MQLYFTSVYIIHFDRILVLLQLIFWENDVYIFQFKYIVWILIRNYGAYSGQREKIQSGVARRFRKYRATNSPSQHKQNLASLKIFSGTDSKFPSRLSIVYGNIGTDRKVKTVLYKARHRFARRCKQLLRINRPNFLRCFADLLSPKG